MITASLSRHYVRWMTVLAVCTTGGSLLLLLVQQGDLKRYSMALSWISFGYLAVSLLCLVWIARSSLTRLIAPLRELTLMADRIGAGERDVPIRLQGRQDEIGVLSQAIYRMVRSIREGELRIQQLNRELEEKNRELEQVVYAASHDLRSPLINIQGFAQELKASFNELAKELEASRVLEAHRELETSRELEAHREWETSRERDGRRVKLQALLQEIPEAFTFILASTSKMDRLLNALLHYSRLGRERMTPRRLDMNRLVLGVLQGFAFQLEERGFDHETEEMPDCWADESMMDQVLANLVENALKFRVPGRRGMIRITGRQEPGRCVYRVEDNGIGIPEANRMKIFKLFEQLDNKQPGDGLGLAIVRRIMNRHQGDVWVESEPGQGSAFCLAFPDPPEEERGEDEWTTK